MMTGYRVLRRSPAMKRMIPAPISAACVTTTGNRARGVVVLCEGTSIAWIFTISPLAG